MTQRVAHTELLAWCAGTFEGEGSVYISRANLRRNTSPRFRINVTVTNCDVLLLEPFQDTWGGRLRARKGSGLTRKQVFEWRRECVSAEKFLRDILPYLKGKKRGKAIAALALHERQKLDVRSAKGKGRYDPVPPEEMAHRLELIKSVRTKPFPQEVA